MPKIKTLVGQVTHDPKLGRPVSRPPGTVIEVSDRDAYNLVTSGSGVLLDGKEKEASKAAVRKAD